MKKNKIKNIATIMTVVLGTGILSSAETLNEGINLGDNTSNAIGSGSLATGRGTNAIGSNAFASGNNMTREQYEEFIKQNNERLKEIEDKMKEVLAARGDLTNLENEHREIANKIKAIETYRIQIAEKERILAEKEPILTREIKVKKGEKVSYRTQIEDLERRLNIIGQLDFSTINDSNRGQAIDVLAQDLKTKMENGVTFLSENGIPVEEYKKAILKQIEENKQSIINKELRDNKLYTTEYDRYWYNDSGNITYNYNDVYLIENKFTNWWTTSRDFNSQAKNDLQLDNILVDKNHNYHKEIVTVEKEIKTIRELFPELENKWKLANTTQDKENILYDMVNALKTTEENIRDKSNTTIKYNPLGRPDYTIEYRELVDDLDTKIEITKTKKTFKQIELPTLDDVKNNIITPNMNKSFLGYNGTGTSILNGNTYRFYRVLTDIAENERFNSDTISKFKQYRIDIANISNQISEELNKGTDEALLKAKKIMQDRDKKIIDIIKEYGINLTKIGLDIDYTIFENIKKNNIDLPTGVNITKFYNEEYLRKIYDKAISEITNLRKDETGSFEKTKELMEKAEYYFNPPTSELNKKFQAEIDRLKSLEKDTQNQITIKENEITGYRSDITNLTNLLNGENPGNIDDVTRQINEKKELIANKEKEIETLKANITNISDGENALANGTNSRALGKAAISIGTNNYTNQESSIALGTNNTVNGEKSIAIGYGHNIQGSRNATLGDPNTIYGNDNFVIGNNITIGSEENPVNNNLVFGSNINIQNVSNAIVLGNGSEAVENAVSVGKVGAERKIVNVADGLISEKSKEAINGSQLYKFSLLLDDKLSKINLAPSTPKVDTSIINADIANALAIAGIPQVSGNKLFSLGAGTGYNAGQAAIALGISGQTPNKMFIFKVSGAVNLKKGYSVSAGVNINFGDIEDYNNKKLENEIKKLNERIEKQENKPLVIKDYSKELINLNNKNKDLEKLNKDLSKELEVIKERLNEMNNNVEMNYSLDNFDFDKSELKESHKQILDRLNFKYAKSIFLVGYADEKGTNEYNQKLSEKRAKVVYDYLREKGITQDIYYLGRGKQNLISSIQEKNRRVEISIK